MSFEDRLRDHLTNQVDSLDITPEGPQAVADRHARRSRNHLGASAAAIALVLVGGFGLWSFADRTPEPRTTVTAAPNTTEPAGDGDGDVAFATDEVVEDTAQGLGSSSEPTIVSTKLEAVESIDDQAPGSAWDTKVDGSVYYVLSTAPAESGVDEAGFAGDGYYRANTIYRFDEETGWTNNEVTDRWISDFTPSDGVLYVLSTGRVDGSVDGAIGVSSDQGATWDWQSVPGLNDLIDVDEQYGVSPTTLRLIPVDGRSFVLAQTLGWPDFEEGVELAVSSGLDVTRAQIVDVNPNGVTYSLEQSGHPDQACWSIMDRFYMASSDVWAEFESDISTEAEYRALVDEVQPRLDEMSGPFEAELVEAGCQNEIACQRILGAYYELGSDLFASLGEPGVGAEWREAEQQVRELQRAQAPEFEAQLEAAGCDNQIRCDRIAQEAVALFDEEQASIDDAYWRFDELTDEEREQLQLREQVLWTRMEAARRPALVEAGCLDPGLVDGPEAHEHDPGDFVNVTWDELGVAVPDSWGASSRYYEYQDGQLVERDLPFGGEVVVGLNPGASETQAITIPEQSYFGYSEGVEGATWTTSDGLAWTRSGSTEAPYGPVGGPGSYTLGDVSLRINWQDGPIADVPVDLPPIPSGVEILTTEDGQPYFVDESGEQVVIPLPPPPSMSLERSVADGPWEAVQVSDLAPELDLPDNVAVDQLYGSEVGVALILRSSGPGDARVVYSSDGVTWNMVSMEADWISGVTVGDSLLFVGSRFPDQGEVPGPASTLLLRPAS